MSNTSVIDYSLTRKRPPKNPLWDEYFRVRMLYLHSRTIEQLKIYGQRVSGVPQIDKDLDRQEIETEMNIDAMFEKWRMGVTVRVVRYDDTARIYQIIHDHLVRFAEHMHQGVNHAAVPLEDLVQLDEFAGIVYDKAVHVFTKEERNLALSSNIAGVQTLNFHNILKRARSPQHMETHVNASGQEVTTIVTKGVKPEEPKRNSLKSIFESELQRMHGWNGST